MRLLLLAALAFGAGLEPKDDVRWRSEPGLIAPVPLNWTKLYPLTPYKAHWTYELETSDFDKVFKALQKLGLRPTQPLEMFPITRIERQASFRGSFKQAQSADKKLLSLGKIKSVRQRPVAEPISLAEVNEKLDKLSRERAQNGEALSKMPHASAAVEELIGHLQSVKAMQERTDSEVLINLTLLLK